MDACAHITNSNTTGTTSGTVTGYSSGALECTMVFSGVLVPRSFVFCVVFCTSLFVLFLLTIMLFVLWLTASDYPFGIFWLLCCLSFDLHLLITTLVSFDYYVVCALTYIFWLPLWYLLTIMLFVFWLTASDYPFGIFWLSCCLSFDLQLLITPLVFSKFSSWLRPNHCFILHHAAVRFAGKQQIPML